MRGNTQTENRIREAILASGVSTNALAKELGISQPSVWKFLHRQTSLSMEYAQRYMDHFGLAIGTAEEFGTRSSR